MNRFRQAIRYQTRVAPDHGRETSLPRVCSPWFARLSLLLKLQTARIDNPCCESETTATALGATGTVTVKPLVSLRRADSWRANCLPYRASLSKLPAWPAKECINRRIFLCSRSWPRSFSKAFSFFRRRCSNCAISSSRRWKPIRCWRNWPTRRNPRSAERAGSRGGRKFQGGIRSAGEAR